MNAILNVINEHESNSDELTVIKVNELCRTCLSRENVIYHVNHVVSGVTARIMEMLKIFPEIKIVNNDNLPPRICEGCLRQLKAAFDFKQKSLHSQNLLTSIINKTPENTTNNINTRKMSNTINIEENIPTINHEIHKPSSVQKPVSQDTNKTYSANKVNGVKPVFSILESKKSNVKTNNENAVNEIQSIDNNQQNKRSENLAPAKKKFKAVKNVESPSKFKCVVCNGSLFDSEELVISHLKKHHSKRCEISTINSCVVCDINFDTRDLLKEHYLSIHSVRTVINKVNCSICDKECLNKGHLKIHFKLAHTFQSNTVCTNCCGYYRTFKMYENHLINCPKVNFVSLSCNACPNSSFTSVQTYLEHSANDHGVHNCVFCLKSWGEKDLLTQHLDRVHFTDRTVTFECRECRTHFISRWELMNHMKSRHNMQTESVFCGECVGDSISKVIDGNKHFMEHLDACHRVKKFDFDEEIPIEIEISDAIVDSNNDEAAIIVNNDQNDAVSEQDPHLEEATITPTPCKMCPKLFDKKQIYMKHLITHHGKSNPKAAHLGRRIFSCSLCGQCFLTATSMKDHMHNVHQQNST